MLAFAGGGARYALRHPICTFHPRHDHHDECDLSGPSPKGAEADCGRVEEGRGGLSLRQSLRLPSPLIEPDVRFSRIRLSDRLHAEAQFGGVRASLRNRMTPSLPKMVSSENRLVPSEGTL
jgi:hypothetical protein